MDLAIRRIVGICLLALASGACVVGIALASSSGRAKEPSRAFAIFRARHHLAHRAQAGGSSSSTLAYAGPDGQVYAIQRGSDLCVLFVDPRGVGSEGCAHAADASVHGAGIAVPPLPGSTAPGRIALLVPDKVKHVQFVLDDGTTIDADPANNVAFYSSRALRHAEYVDAGGTPQRANVPRVTG